MDKETIKIEVQNKEVNKILQFISDKVKDPKPILREFWVTVQLQPNEVRH